MKMKTEREGEGGKGEGERIHKTWKRAKEQKKKRIKEKSEEGTGDLRKHCGSIAEARKLRAGGYC